MNLSKLFLFENFRLCDCQRGEQYKKFENLCHSHRLLPVNCFVTSSDCCFSNHIKKEIITSNISKRFFLSFLDYLCHSPNTLLSL